MKKYTIKASKENKKTDDYIHSDENDYEYDDYDDEDISYDEWYDSDESEDQGMEFVNEVTSILEEKYPGCDVFEEPSVQGHLGDDVWTITYQDKEYSIEFDWDTEMLSIFVDGPESAAKYYSDKIINQIDSGEALIEY